MQHGARSYITIHADALRANYLEFCRVVGEESGVLPVVKARAYGHGLTEVVSALAPLSPEGVVVDAVDEGLKVRALLPDAAIFCVGFVPPERYAEAVSGRLICSLFAAEDIPGMAAAAEEAGKPFLGSLEIETGLHRLGVGGRELAHLIEAIQNARGAVLPVSASSHLATAEDLAKVSFVQQQNAVFCDAIQKLPFVPAYRHISCTGSSILSPRVSHTHIRLGLGFYGLWPSDDVRREGTLGGRHVALRPALSFFTQIAQVKDVPLGGTVGYGQTFVAQRPMRIAVLPVGYADGLCRRLSGVFVLIRGQRCPLIGRICMNMCMVDITSAPQTVTAKERVVLIGREGAATLRLDEWAQAAGTITYEVAVGLPEHLPRYVI